MDDVAILVMDEADRLLEMGFEAEIKELVKSCPRERQTLLFSATLTDKVEDLAAVSLRSPVRLSADGASATPDVSFLSQEFVKIRDGSPDDTNEQKEAVLLALCSRTYTKRTIIFAGTKQTAHRLKILFGLVGLKASELHGNLTQAQRLSALEDFRVGVETDFLIATDVAARGLDITGVEGVINFDAPRTIEGYSHRVGRTARAGKKGRAITLATELERPLLKKIAKTLTSRSLPTRSLPTATINQY